MNTATLIVLVLVTTKIFSQDFVNDTSKIHENFSGLSYYHTPIFIRSDKIYKLVNTYREKLPTSSDSSIYMIKPVKISDADFNALNAYEHFIYSFSYPESYYQSCTYTVSDKEIWLKIPTMLSSENGLGQSQRQKNAITEHRDSSIMLMRKCIEKSGSISNDFKRTIVSLKAFELIPTIVKTVTAQKPIKDPSILTTLCLLMRFDYEPFSQSELYNTLYPTDSLGYYSSKESYRTFIPFTQLNYHTIIDYALDYYRFKNTQISDFVKVSGGRYIIGEEGHTVNPKREVEIKPFQISRYEVTNRQFMKFVKSTGYITLAEENKDALVFRLGLDEFEWQADSTANWRFPNGVSEGGINEKMDHPVTCISFVDAEAYCHWAGVKLPSIEQWEIASRAGEQKGRYHFGKYVDSIYKYANIWHGQTHLMKYEGEDYITTSPVGSFKPNKLGLYDIYGNVFEFCSNTPQAFSANNNLVATRGGSWWCSVYACGFFNSVDIGRVQKTATFSNNGFRVVR